jgi:hypothetical protein
MRISPAFSRPGRTPLPTSGSPGTGPGFIRNLTVKGVGGPGILPRGIRQIALMDLNADLLRNLAHCRRADRSAKPRRPRRKAEAAVHPPGSGAPKHVNLGAMPQCDEHRCRKLTPQPLAHAGMSEPVGARRSAPDAETLDLRNTASCGASGAAPAVITHPVQPAPRPGWSDTAGSQRAIFLPLHHAETAEKRSGGHALPC